MISTNSEVPSGVRQSLSLGLSHLYLRNWVILDLGTLNLIVSHLPKTYFWIDKCFVRVSLSVSPSAIDLKEMVILV